MGVVQLDIARAQSAWSQVFFAGVQICHQRPTVVCYFEFEPGNLTSSGRQKERQHDISQEHPRRHSRRLCSAAIGASMYGGLPFCSL
jgi:hypothetical protein